MTAHNDLRQGHRTALAVIHAYISRFDQDDDFVTLLLDVLDDADKCADVIHGMAVVASFLLGDLASETGRDVTDILQREMLVAAEESESQ
jgi:hypothetical protein